MDIKNKVILILIIILLSIIVTCVVTYKNMTQKTYHEQIKHMAKNLSNEIL